MLLRKTRLALAAAAVSVTPLTLVASTPAAAANACCWYVDGPRTSYIGVAERNAPYLWARTGRFGLAAGARVGLWCWSYGDRVGPNGNSLWWAIDAFDGRGDFWVADHLVSG